MPKTISPIKTPAPIIASIIKQKAQLVSNFKAADFGTFMLTPRDEKIQAADRNYIESKLNLILKQRILEDFKDADETVLKRIEQLNVDYKKAANHSVSEYILSDVSPLIQDGGRQGNGLPPSLNVNDDNPVNDLLNLDKPLKNNPIFSDELRLSRIVEYTQLGGVHNGKVEAIKSMGIDPVDFDMIHFETLVKDNVITEKEKDDIHQVFELAKLTSDNLSLIRALRSKSLRSVRELVSWDKKQWLDFFKQENIQLPENQNAEEFVDIMVANLRKNFPSRYLLHKSVQTARQRIQNLDAISPLLKNNPNILNPENDSIDWTGINGANKTVLEKQLKDLRSTLRYFRNLGIGEILSDQQTNLQTKGDLLDNRVQQFETFAKNNSDRDTKVVDFFDEEETGKFNWTGVDENNRKGIKKQMMAVQRVTLLHDEPGVSDKLMEAGFDSANSIVAAGYEKVLKQTGLPEDDVQTMFIQANEVAAKTTHVVQSVQLAINDKVGNGLGPANWQVPDYTNKLKEVDGFDDLFGSQDYCDCEHCRSILSPAAYFVDLMYFIEDNVSDAVFKSRPNHALYLRNRRPDLWKLELTCENTNKLIPYLDVVNKVLEEYIKRALSVTDVYKQLNGEQISFNLPFNLYLDELRIYLGHFSTSLFQIFALLKNTDDETWRERMNLSPGEWDVINNPDTTNTVRKRIGDPSAAVFNKFDVKDFIQFAGITRPQLDELLNIRFTQQLNPITIIKEQSNDPLTDPLINYVERLTQLTNVSLDLIHRFIRLWRKTGWTIKEFDMILTTAKNAGLVPATADALKNGILDKTAILLCARLLELQTKLKLTTEELPCLFTSLPDTPVRDNEDGFFTRTFTKQVLENASSISFHHSFKNNDGVTDPKLGFLLGGLGIMESEMIQLFELLEAQIVFDASGNTTLTDANISLLYRHARIAKALKFTIEDLILAMKIIFTSGNQWVESLDRVFSLLEFKRRLQQTKLKVPDLWFILKGEEKGSAVYKTGPEAIYGMIYNLQVQKVIYFEPGFLDSIPGIDTNTSAKFVAEMVTNGLASKKSVTENLFRLSDIYNVDQDLTPVFSAMGASPAVVALTPQIQEKLNAFHAKNILKEHFGKLLNITPELFEKMLLFTTIPVDDGSMYTALYASFDESGVPLTVSDLLPAEKITREFDRLLHLFSKCDLKEANVLFIANNPSAFGITNPTDLSFDHFVNMSEYKKLIVSNSEKEEMIHFMLTDYQANGKLTSDELLLLAETWKTDKNLLSSIFNFIALPSTAMAMIQYAAECHNLCRSLGINGESLLKLKERDFDKLKNARDIIIGSFASKYPDEKERTDKLEPYHDKVNTKKRDALCDFIISHSKELRFNDRSDLYAYFLLDVEMSGCFRTSWIVAANSSLQLYVHRCLMFLEQSGVATVMPDGNNDPDDDALEFVKVTPGMIPQDEWEWRKNYRVWEANRKVFLYPENYILPELRDIKTSIFKVLEEELLQKKVTKETAEAAFQKYIAQFTELASLKNAGCYYDEATDTYYFFARTNVDPPQFYYRQWQQKTIWTAWEKIEVGINGPYVSSIVYAGRLYIFWTECRVKEVTGVSGGGSTSDGYDHEIYFVYSYLDESKKWTTPQRLHHNTANFPYDYDSSGILNRKLYPGIHDKKLYAFYADYEMNLGGMASAKRIDVFNNKLIDPEFVLNPADTKMTSGTNLINVLESGSTQSLISVKEEESLHEAKVDDNLIVTSSTAPQITSSFDKDIYQPELRIVGRNHGEFVFRIGNQQYLMRHGYTYMFPTKWRMIPIGTTLPHRMGEKLFMDGLDNFLGLEQMPISNDKPLFDDNPQRYKEEDLPFIINDIMTLAPPHYSDSHPDFKGSYGEYYRELFFHVPFLIASFMNTNFSFKESQWWYSKIFSPMSPSQTDPPKDRNWQYIEFRGLTIKTLQQILTDPAAIKAYEKDPFNPHAIARLRLNAYQKTIVMKYIDNLLDWGDALFAQDSMESINEATMLYVLAYDILGKRPVKLGKCTTASENALTYEKLGPAMGEESDFLIELENFTQSLTLQASKGEVSQAMAVNEVSKKKIHTNSKLSDLTVNEDSLDEEEMTLAFTTAQATVNRRLSYDYVDSYDAIVKEKQNKKPAAKSKSDAAKFKKSKSPHVDVVKEKLVAFCIPNNEELLKYWDRVEDRLFKIRNCMNISGVRRQLALFQPPIDPMMLVKAKAAGLSLDDILTEMNKPLPLYRFTYLLEKARQIAQTVQSFGTALLSALEKKDVEELTLIRSVNEKEILDLTTQIKKQAIQETQNQYLSLAEQETNVQNKIEHYNSLIDEGLTGWEIVQQISKHTATGLKITEGGTHMLGGIMYLLPQSGSPFAMKYGGQELGHSSAEFAQWTAALASVADAVSSSAGLEATFQRREEEWDLQLNLARQELKSIQKQMLAADLKIQMAERDLEIHEKNIEHNEEIEDFYKNKFTNLGLYNFLATTLTRLYRESYNIAYDTAKMAEQAYQFERDDDNVFIAPDNWQFDKAGLLAGEKLLLQLHRLEKTYLQNNRRDYEVSQSFSMQTINPSALIELRQKGSCTLEIPELAFDLYYPGQYRRVIKSVRLTIPCLVGPHANVSCKLSLVDSKIRKEALVDTEHLISVPFQKLTSIATSNAQNDGGVFELNFRDERYLPFEGAGAVSTWRLELPNKIRTFEYSSISDVIFHISYAAKDDGLYRETIEEAIEDAIGEFASDPERGLFRMFSMRYEFPDVFHRLLNSNEIPQVAEFELLRNHFPFMFSGKDLSLNSASVYLKSIKDQSITPGLTLSLNSFTISTWTDFPDDGSVDAAYILKQGSVNMNGTPFKKWKIDAGANGLKKEEIDDVFIVIRYAIV